MKVNFYLTSSFLSVIENIFQQKISAAILHCLRLSSKVKSSPLLQRGLLNEDITILMCDWRFQSLTQKHCKICLKSIKPTTPWQIVDLKNELLCDFFHKTPNFLLGKAKVLKFLQNRTKTKCWHNDLPYTLLMEALPLHCSRTTFIMKLDCN